MNSYEISLFSNFVYSSSNNIEFFCFNLINALVLLNEQGVSYNIEKNTKHRGFSNYIELTLINKDTQIKIGATVLNGYGPRIVRINDH